ncbi:MAG TPA: hypothetical protein VNH41_12135 [Steroidobacteraceae bacterium]|nr:hypothetical protein [Steroidobacteraceae bacterium]
MSNASYLGMCTKRRRKAIKTARKYKTDFAVYLTHGFTEAELRDIISRAAKDARQWNHRRIRASKEVQS